VANGGTGQTTYTNGQLLIGNTTGNTLTKASLTAGSGITITPGTGTITIAATASGLTFNGDSGSATESGGIVIIAGGTGLTSSATGNTVTVNLDTPVSVVNGGTGQSSYTNGQLLIGNTISNTLSLATLTAGSGVAITNGTGTITLAAGTNVATTYTADSGSATPSANNLDVVGTGGIVTSGTGDTITIDGSAIVPGNLLINDFEKTMVYAEDFAAGPGIFTDLGDDGSGSNEAYITKDHPGIWRWGSTSSTNCRGIMLAYTETTEWIKIGGGQVTMEIWTRFTTTPTSGSIFFGLGIGMSGTGPAAGTDFVAFRVANFASSSELTANTRLASTTTTTSSGNNMGTTWIKLSIIINADATSVGFYVNDSNVATHTTNIPLNTTGLSYGCVTLGSHGANVCMADFAQIFVELNGERT
tara:strand:+ start:877 stop:2124 length:1248 start_codon:yes stop_codon:yes gene_type:complete